MHSTWRHSDWPNFHYDLTAIDGDLLRFSDQAGQVTGILKALPDCAESETVLHLMVTAAMKTSEIEDETLSRPDVMSALRHRRGLDTDRPVVRDRSAEGAAELMVTVRQTMSPPSSAGIAC